MKEPDSLFKQLTTSQDQVQAKLDVLKASPAGKTFARLDAKAGRLIGIARALFWFASTLVITAMSYGICWFVEGWKEMATITVTIVLVSFCIWRGMLNALSPGTASEAVLDEMEGRLGAIIWVPRLLMPIFGRRGRDATD